MNEWPAQKDRRIYKPFTDLMKPPPQPKRPGARRPLAATDGVWTQKGRPEPLLLLLWWPQECLCASCLR